MWTVAIIRNWQELSLPGSPPNSCVPRTRDVMCPSNVPCFDRLRHCIQLCWTWKEGSMVNMEVTAGLKDALLMLANGPKEIPDDAMNIIERFVILMFDRTSTCTKVDHARRKLFPQEKLWHSESHLPELLWWSMSREQSTRLVTSGGRHCYQTLCCHHQLTGGGWRQKEWMSPTGWHCHKHQNPATSWSLVAARVVAESAADARRLHFSAQASASVRENVPADSKISHVLNQVPCHVLWQVVLPWWTINMIKMCS